MNVTANVTATVTQNVTSNTAQNLLSSIFTVKVLAITSSVLLILLLVCYFLISMAGPYLWFGIKLQRAKSKLGASNVGLMFLRNKSNNFSLPAIIDLQNFKFTRKKSDNTETYLYARDQLKDGKFFGFPYCIFDDDDNKTSVGLYYAHTNADGSPAYEDVIVGYDENKKPVIRKKPVITPIKPAVTLPPEFYKSILDGEKMSKSIKDFLDKYQNLFYILLGIGALVLIVGFIVYNVKTKDIPQVINACKSAVTAAESCKNIGSYIVQNGTVVLR